MGSIVRRIGGVGPCDTLIELAIVFVRLSYETRFQTNQYENEFIIYMWFPNFLPFQRDGRSRVILPMDDQHHKFVRPDHQIPILDTPA